RRWRRGYLRTRRPRRCAPACAMEMHEMSEFPPDYDEMSGIPADADGWKLFARNKHLQEELERLQKENERLKKLAGETPSNGKTHSGGFPATVTLVNGFEMVPVAIRWIWSGWLAEGKLEILAGAITTGKTTLAIHWAATITSGGRWPDGSQAEAGDVLVWSGEDDPEDTLLPRFLAA